MKTCSPSTTNLARCIFEVAESRPDHPALVGRGGVLSYEALARKITGLAGALEQLGLQTGDRVALLLYNTQAFAVAYFALLSLGIAVVPVNTRLTASEIDVILEDAQAKLLVSSLEFFNTITQLQADCLQGLVLDTELLASEEELDPLLDAFPLGCALYRLNELLARKLEPREPLPYALPANTTAALIYTSGTTGKPKGVILSHRLFCC